MRIAILRTLFVASIVTSVVTLPGCREGAGSRCMETADCHAGLVCILPIGGTPQTGGVCTEPEDLSAPFFDLSIIPTDDMLDGGEDASGIEDLSAPADLSDRG